MSGIAFDLQARVDTARALLARVAREHPAAVFTTSFGAEDMVLFDLIAGYDDDLGLAMKPIVVATLDTGRLPDETYQLWQESTRRYRRKVEPYFPESPAVETFVRLHGINAFYDSLAERKACCHIRKVEPLARALDGRQAWITGMRRAQSSTRADLEVEGWDAEHRLTKFNPLADWSEGDTWDYLRARDVPVNALHARGYPSIGCAPCTRAVAAGEDVRAGRWWWESADAKECGLHAKADDNVLAQPA